MDINSTLLSGFVGSGRLAAIIGEKRTNTTVASAIMLGTTRIDRRDIIKTIKPITNANLGADDSLGAKTPIATKAITIIIFQPIFL